MTGANVSSIKKEEISRTDAASSGSARQMLTWNLSSIVSRFASSLGECLDSKLYISVPNMPLLACQYPKYGGLTNFYFLL